MNGMARKVARKKYAAQFTEDGLPRDANKWTREDWASLYHHMEAVKREVAKRHKAKGRKK